MGSKRHRLIPHPGNSLETPIKENRNMYAVDRSVALIKPRQPFLDWLMILPDSELDLTLEQLRTDCTVFLVPEFLDLEEALGFIDQIYSQIFEMELASWWEDESLWPEHRTVQLFWKWFDVELHSTVVDAAGDPEDDAPPY